MATNLADMANALLDFVMALIRDPDAAARYAADPAGALAAAGLTGVTIADVNNLIPVLSDSLAAANPGFGRPADLDPGAGNVWLSGAAAAAFDAFEVGPAAEPATPPTVIISGEPLSDDALRAGAEADLEGTPIPAPPVQSVTTDWADEVSWSDQTHTDTPLIDAPDMDSGGGPQSATGDPSGF